MEQIKKGILSRIYSNLFQVNVLNSSRARFLYYKTLKSLSESAPALIPILSGPIRKMGELEFTIKNDVGTFAVNMGDDSIGKSSPNFESESHICLKHSKKDLFVDIGANIGFFTVLGVNKYGYGRAICFEPNPLVFARLKSNIDLNNLNDSVEIFNQALGASSDDLLFCRNTVKTGRSRFIDESEQELLEKDSSNMFERVHTQSFDEFARKNAIRVSDIGFIKIDVEGFEYNVLSGMRETLKEASDAKLLVEIWKGSEYLALIVELLANAGFVLRQQIAQNYLFEKK